MNNSSNYRNNEGEASTSFSSEVEKIFTRASKLRKEMKKLKRRNFNDECLRAMAFHHDLHFNIAKLKMTLQQYAKTFSKSTMEDEHAEMKPTRDLDDQNMNSTNKKVLANPESDEHGYFEDLNDQNMNQNKKVLANPESDEHRNFEDLNDQNMNQNKKVLANPESDEHGNFEDLNDQNMNQNNKVLANPESDEHGHFE